MPAQPKLHLLLGNAGQLELLLVLWGLMTKLVEAQTIESLGIGIEFRVEIDGICRIEDSGILGNFGPVGEGDWLARLALEGDFLRLETACSCVS